MGPVGKGAIPLQRHFPQQNPISIGPPSLYTVDYTEPREFGSARSSPPHRSTRHQYPTARSVSHMDLSSLRTLYCALFFVIQQNILPEPAGSGSHPKTHGHGDQTSIILACIKSGNVSLYSRTWINALPLDTGWLTLAGLSLLFRTSLIWLPTGFWPFCLAPFLPLLSVPRVPACAEPTHCCII